MNWTKARLEELATRSFADARFLVVANREPYIHVYDGESIRCMKPASGLTTALDPVMRACGGTWVAHGSGNADRIATNERDCVAVPPEDPRYTLRRVWLSKQEEQGYYYGFANETLWPLCHAAYTRPRFDSDDWEQYQRVNQKFADAVLQEVEDKPAVVFVQDYHFALLPRMLKNARPDLVVMQFWHIPWPNREIFRICPWQEQILDGLLGNDLLSFHIQYHCNNFLETVDRAIEAKIDAEHFSVTRGGKSTLVRPHAISIDFEAITSSAEGRQAQEARIRRQLRVHDQLLLVGVDRVDYIKGIPERFRAIDRLITLHPELKGKFCFVQVGAPSRTHIATYGGLNEDLSSLADQINWRHGDESWKPILLIKEHYRPEQVYALYRIAAGCVVSSLHDGMNLVAKEFIAARDDLRGVLVLSKFTGAARELNDAVQINPYAVDDFAAALRTALTMPAIEQERRMSRMRAHVSENNIYRWAGHLLSDASKLLETNHDSGAGRVEEALFGISPGSPIGAAV